jgi:hypothetical protein
VLEVNVQPKLWSCARPKLEIVAFSPSGRSMRWRHTNLPLDAIANMFYRFLDRNSIVLRRDSRGNVAAVTNQGTIIPAKWARRFSFASSLLYAKVSVAMSGASEYQTHSRLLRKFRAGREHLYYVLIAALAGRPERPGQKLDCPKI